MAVKKEVPRCQHIKTNGAQCRGPAWGERSFCYFHAQWHERARNRAQAAKPETTLPLLEDANSIQVLLMQTIDDIANNRLDRKQAALILYALQTASQNLRRTDFEPVFLR